MEPSRRVRELAVEAVDADAYKAAKDAADKLARALDHQLTPERREHRAG